MKTNETKITPQQRYIRKQLKRKVIKQYNIQLFTSNKEHKKIIDFLTNLDKEKFKSVRNFIIKAILEAIDKYN